MSNVKSKSNKIGQVRKLKKKTPVLDFQFIFPPFANIPEQSIIEQKDRQD